MFYAAYVGLCFAMEATAAGTFRRRHTATAPAPASRREQLHAQLHRMETDNARESWPPYAVYTGVTVVLSLLGGIAGAYLGARWAWRSSGKLSVFRMKLVALGCILGMSAGYLSSTALPSWRRIPGSRTGERRGSRTLRPVRERARSGKLRDLCDASQFRRSLVPMKTIRRVSSCPSVSASSSAPA